ncbi:MAG: CPBP family intramembrane metalloprotease [Deltaproteobacteria bacterium]|nr:CPBP family intramembrane metalloprotease [Deltaproteobacteria bacterium]
MSAHPVFRSEPTPARPDGIQPMSAFAATLWVTGATFAFLFLGSLVIALRESAARDQTVLIGCQAAAYLLALFGILRMHGPEAPIRAFVALRRTHAALYPLALVAGAASAFWGSWLLDRIHRRFPDPENANRLVELFFEATPAGRIAMGVGIVVVGPLVEELVFRGALFGPMTRRHGTSVVIGWTAVTFAMVHVEPRVLLPILLLGLAMGLLRAASGSLWPSLLFHVGFNGAQFADLYTHPGPPVPGATPEAMPGWQATAGVATFAACIGLSLLIATRSEASTEARRQADEL